MLTKIYNSLKFNDNLKTNQTLINALLSKACCD